MNFFLLSLFAYLVVRYLVSCLWSIHVSYIMIVPWADFLTRSPSTARTDLLSHIHLYIYIYMYIYMIINSAGLRNVGS